MKADTSKGGKKSDRLNGVPVTYGTKMKAVFPNTGMKSTDQSIDTKDGIKIIKAIKKTGWTKRFDTVMTMLTRTLVFIIIFATIVSIFIYCIGK